MTRKDGEIGLSEAQISDLIWMERVGIENRGLFGPSVHKHGPVESCAQLCEMGFAEYREYKSADAWGGYFITNAGRAALAKVTKGTSS